MSPISVRAARFRARYLAPLTPADAEQMWQALRCEERSLCLERRASFAEASEWKKHEDSSDEEDKGSDEDSSDEDIN